VIRVHLPANLQTLAGTGREVHLEVDGPVTQRKVLDVLEAQHPELLGTIRDAVTKKRRPSSTPAAADPAAADAAAAPCRGHR